MQNHQLNGSKDIYLHHLLSLWIVWNNDTTTVKRIRRATPTINKNTWQTGTKNHRITDKASTHDKSVRQHPTVQNNLLTLQ